MDYKTTGGMQVARTLYDFVNAEAIPGPASSRPASGRASAHWSAIWRRATRHCSTGATNCSDRSMRGIWNTEAGQSILSPMRNSCAA